MDPTSGEEVWRFKHDDRDFYGAPLLDDECLYVVSDNGDAFALGRAAARVIWHAPLRQTCTSAMSRTGSLVFVSLRDGRVVALEESTGGQVWECNLADYGAVGDIVALPTAKDDALFLLAGNGSSLSLFSLDPLSGTLRWRFHPDPRRRIGPRSNSSQVLTDDAVYFGHWDRTIFAVSRTGEELWSFQPDRSRTRFEDLDGIFPDDIPVGAPGDLVAANGLLYVPQMDYRMYTLQLETGELVWDWKGSDCPGPALIANGWIAFAQQFYQRRGVTSEIVVLEEALD